MLLTPCESTGGCASHEQLPGISTPEGSKDLNRRVWGFRVQGPRTCTQGLGWPWIPGQTKVLQIPGTRKKVQRRLSISERPRAWDCDASQILGSFVHGPHRTPPPKKKKKHKLRSLLSRAQEGQREYQGWGCNAMHKASRMDGASSSLEMLELL